MPVLGEVHLGHHGGGFVNDPCGHRGTERQCFRRDIVSPEPYYRGRVETDRSWIQVCEVVGDVNKAQQQRRARHGDNWPR